MQEIEIEQIPGKVTSTKRFEINEFSEKQEVGGLIIGYRTEVTFNDPETGVPKTNVQFEPVILMQVPNKSKERNLYTVSNAFRAFGCVTVDVWKGKLKIKEILQGLTIVGEFHSQLSGTYQLSKGDMTAIKQRCKQFGSWLVGVLVIKNNRVRMAFTPYQINNKTISKHER